MDFSEYRYDLGEIHQQREIAEARIKVIEKMRTSTRRFISLVLTIVSVLFILMGVAVEDGSLAEILLLGLGVEGLGALLTLLLLELVWGRYEEQYNTLRLYEKGLLAIIHKNIVFQESINKLIDEKDPKSEGFSRELHWLQTLMWELGVEGAVHSALLEVEFGRKKTKS